MLAYASMTLFMSCIILPVLSFRAGRNLWPRGRAGPEEGRAARVNEAAGVRTAFAGRRGRRVPQPET